MFDSKSPVVKVGGYIIIGFFLLIIIISFGMPDFMSRMGMDENMVAMVNGEEIHRLDYIRYRERFSRLLKDSKQREQMERMILDRMIMQRLMLQKAREVGIELSHERVKNSIKDIPFFRDENGKFDSNRLNRYLEGTHQSLTNFYVTYEDDLIDEEFRNMISAGIGISPDEVSFEQTIDKSQIQIKYCFVSDKDLKKKHKSKLKVSKKEIDDELNKNKEEIKDPKTDRNRIKKKLENKKFNTIKNEIAQTIDKWAQEKKNFSKAASYLGGKVFFSNVFKLGEQVKQQGKKGKILYSIGNSQIFKDNCLSMKKGKTSRAISSYDGIYVFTPVKKKVDLKRSPQSDTKKIVEKLKEEKYNHLLMTLMTDLRDKSKIAKNLKFN